MISGNIWSNSFVPFCKCRQQIPTILPQRKCSALKLHQLFWVQPLHTFSNSSYLTLMDHISCRSGKQGANWGIIFFLLMRERMSTTRLTEAQIHSVFFFQQNPTFFPLENFVSVKFTGECMVLCTSYRLSDDNY